ncbi:SpaA isopeptide-forming pilin-related protein [Leuconostoc pseudomesenteroides]|uniref:SpaA isopeptide-forming pilin-related protein n=1 Tax=Leuconostoc pseudomesenteroides TaxID=33968 RepID=UPI0021A4AD6E|nr:SpaA isopeptide-forming pilin-related protein [Leuconostoc pseudomesenteroides]MCT4379512.1 isopeptide-forming domain-containing fimbrial protein [Leuconostoc pseudomesenteroides]
MKAKNLILTSVLLAPMILTSGSALASATKPSSTDVVINKVQSATDGEDAQNIFQNDGSAMDLETGWTIANAKFTVYHLTDDAIDGFDTGDRPKIGSDYSTYLEVVNSGASAHPDVNPYTIRVKAGQEAAFKTFLASKGGVSRIVNNQETTGGQLRLDNLAEGHYVAFETGYSASTKTHAVPMVISVPLLNPNATGTGDTWFDNTDNEYNIYAKNYTDVGELKVKKVGEDKKTIAGAVVGLVNSSVYATQSKTDVQNALSQLVRDLAKDKVNTVAGVKEYIPTWITKMTTDGFFTAAQATAATSILGQVDFRLTTADGVTYSDLTPGDTYGVTELTAPNNYMVNGQLQEVTLSNADSTATSDTKAGYGAADNTVYYRNSTFKLVNYETPDVDKTIDTNQDGVFEDNDTKSGVSRGEDFQWKIESDIDDNINTYTKYDIVDTLPYQTNWISASIALKSGSTTTQLATLEHFGADGGEANKITDTMGLTGHGLFYDTDPTSAKKYDVPNKDAGKTTDTSDAIQQARVSLAAVTGSGFTADDFRIYGVSSTYTFADNNRVVNEASKNDGKLVIELTESGRQKVANKLNITDTNAKLVVTLDMRANAAAQTGDIENTVDLNVDNGYTTSTDTDKSKTFDAGWELVKTDSGDLTKPLAGAGFKLGMKVTQGTNGNINAVWKLLYENKNNVWGSEDTSNQFSTFAAFKDWVDSKGAGNAWVYFMHVDEDGNPMDHMMSMSDDPMGDIIWSIDANNATTHMTGDDGYLQYCGLAGGDYKLVESHAPSGYKLMDDVEFSLGADGTTNSNYINGQPSGVVNGVADADDINVANYKKSTFPVTGGIGMLGALMMGAMLMVASRIKKRNRDEKTSTLIRK